MEALKELFRAWSGVACTECVPIAANGSNRQYYRLSGASHRCIGAINPDVRENRAFFYYSRFFFQQGLPVPELYGVSPDETCYLQQDLGDDTLYQLLQAKRANGAQLDVEAVMLLKRALSDLVAFQVAGRSADFSHAYPRQAFDAQSIQWDLNYFKYYFLKTSGVAFDEQSLEDDFQALIARLLKTDCGYFLYRDFQPRNIMLNGGRLYYIDYQGGRRGASQYDVASLLYSSKTDLPESLREELLEDYVACLAQQVAIDPTTYKDEFYSYVLVRMLQAMGAYGFRGLFERKEYFLQSIPLAKRNLGVLLERHPQSYVPYLSSVLQKMIEVQ